MYQLLIERRASKEIELLPAEILNTLIKVVASLEHDPRPHGVKKLFSEDGWRI